MKDLIEALNRAHNLDERLLTESSEEDPIQDIVSYIYDNYGIYMSSLGSDNSGKITFETEEEVDSSDGLDLSDFRYDLHEEFEGRFELEFELEDSHTIQIHVKEIILDWDDDDAFEEFVEDFISYEGRCKYCSLEGSLPNVLLTWISQEDMDENIAEEICKRTSQWFIKTVGKDVNVDATMYCRDTPQYVYTAKFKVGEQPRINIPGSNPSVDEIAERVPNYLENHPYDSSMDAEEICDEIAQNLFDTNYDSLESEASYRLYRIVQDYLDELSESFKKNESSSTIECTKHENRV